MALTFTGGGVKYSKLKILATSHLVTKHDLFLQVKDGDVRAIKSHTRLGVLRRKLVENGRHVGREVTFKVVMAR